MINFSVKHRAPVLSVIILDCNQGAIEGFSPQHDHLGPHKGMYIIYVYIKLSYHSCFVPR